MSENQSRPDEFRIGKESLPITLVETAVVKEGVECDIYAFVGDIFRDLAIVRVTKGFKTPVQRILTGLKTTEGFISGEGMLTVVDSNGAKNVYEFKLGETGKPVDVTIGQVMQWYASGDSDLTFYEICEPPYQDGRYENLPEEYITPID